MKPQEREYCVGERLSLKHERCTVRYVGPVADKLGTWLGVEWDDTKRGKHDGHHDGVSYFTCRSKSPTAASFLRPNQALDRPRTFLQALHEKYMPEFRKDEAEVVYISGKQAEEVGFEKFSQRQAKLQGIHVLVLNNMQIQHSSVSEDDVSIIRALCAEIVELDLSDNLFEKFDEVVQLCNLLPKLKTLTLDGNRFAISLDKIYAELPAVSSLGLSRTLLREAEVDKILSMLPRVKSLNLTNNEIADAVRLKLPPGLTTLDLSDNNLGSLSDLHYLASTCPRSLVLKRNRISAISAELKNFSLRVVELDSTYNNIDSWKFFDDITIVTLPSLKHLRVTGNPLYKDLISAEGKPLTTEDGYMLTIARLPQLESLNYAKITEKERLNAETYYLNQIAIEISRAPEGGESDIISQHPRYRELCEEYGEPTIQRKPKPNEIDPNSLAAKLLTMTFILAPQILPNLNQRSWIEVIPKSFSIYALLGMVGKQLGITPLNLRLVLETNERDPVGRDGTYNGPEWWDSSDDEVEDVDGEWVKREVELIAGTRALGTYVEGREASVRVEMRSGKVR